MTSEAMDRHATLAMTVLFHHSGCHSGFVQASPIFENYQLCPSATFFLHPTTPDWATCEAPWTRTKQWNSNHYAWAWGDLGGAWFRNIYCYQMAKGQI